MVVILVDLQREVEEHLQLVLPLDHNLQQV
jgi:hypothetical protein